MFTGIIAAGGKILEKVHTGGDFTLTFSVGSLDLGDVQLGDSIAVNGVCLTVVEMRAANTFTANVSLETIQRSGFAHYQVGQTVNLEKALRLSDRLGGHLVSGHIDGIGSVNEIKAEAQSYRVSIALPATLCRYVAEKGSICVDGVSLTVNTVHANLFSVNIVPHTWRNTLFAEYTVGSKVNLEVDLIARYTERLLAKDDKVDAGITAGFLAEHGYRG